MEPHFILYVEDQDRSTAFYSAALSMEPTLNVPGMTEFSIGDSVLGLMPEDGIKRLLGTSIEHPRMANGVPRAEVYLIVDKPDEYHQRSIAAGGRELSPLSPRDWGHIAAYSQDPDGHILAFASENA